MALTQTDLDAINTALAHGELTVRAANGSTVTYRSVDELLKARKVAQEDIAAAASLNRNIPRHQLASFSDD